MVGTHLEYSHRRYSGQFFFPFNVVLIWTFTLWHKIRSGEIQSFSSRLTLKYVKIVPLLWLEISSILLRTIFEELIRGEKKDLKEDRKIRHQVNIPIDTDVARMYSRHR